MKQAFGRCPICGEERRRERRFGPSLVVTTCADCGHRTATHADAPRPALDYHQQYEQGSFVEALRRTRVRQAHRVLGMVRSHAPRACRLLDFGCGRGWLMEEARLAGFDPVAGADTSELAVEAARGKGFAAVRVGPDRPEDLDMAALGFRPEVLTVLDVVEHFPPERAQDVLSSLVRKLSPELQIVVIKVPLSSGLLYRVAVALARTGAAGALEQLYQVGTSPPHLSYFSRASLARLLEGANLEVIAAPGDRDFEAFALAHRVRALRTLPSWGGAAFGGALSALIEVAHLHDSVICVARPRGAPRT